MKTRVILKALTIPAMLISVIMILTTVILAKAEVYTFDLMTYHMGAGIIFLSILPIHVFMMRHKLKKLSEQILLLVSAGEVASSCASQLLPNALNSKSLGEFCRFLGLDCGNVREKLNLNGIMIINTEASIETIASANRTDAMRIFSIMLQKDISTTPTELLYHEKFVFAA